MMAEKWTKVLFVCVHNSARSVMAEEFARLHGSGSLRVSSSGFEPKPILPLALEVMQERGLDISTHQPRSVYDLHDNDFHYDYIVLLCDDTHGHVLPPFPGATVLHWPLPEPSKFSGSLEIRKRDARIVRDSIEEMVRAFIKDVLNTV